MTTFTAWGKTYTTAAAAELRVDELNEANALYGLSDDRVCELAAIKAATPAPAPAAKPVYLGWVVREFDTNNKSHYMNQWDETFCGVAIANRSTVGASDRAECRKCRQAGDAAMVSDFASGSPAHR